MIWAGCRAQGKISLCRAPSPDARKLATDSVGVGRGEVAKQPDMNPPAAHGRRGCSARLYRAPQNEGPRAVTTIQPCRRALMMRNIKPKEHKTPPYPLSLPKTNICNSFQSFGVKLKSWFLLFKYPVKQFKDQRTEGKQAGSPRHRMNCFCTLLNFLTGQNSTLFIALPTSRAMSIQPVQQA